MTAEAMNHEVYIDGVRYVAVVEKSEETPAPAPLRAGYVSFHFREAEFDCNHCGRYGNLISRPLLAVLESVRDHFGGAAITVNSGVRCDLHNANVGSVKNSRHRTEFADAADIVVRGVVASRVADYLEANDPGAWGIGRYPRAGFTHIDVRGYSARWSG